MFTLRLCGGVKAMLWPSSRICPPVGCSNPAIIRSVVVLPQPDGPSMEKNSPAGICRLMPSTAITSLNSLTRSTTSTSPPVTRHVLSGWNCTTTSNPESGDVVDGRSAPGFAASEEAVDQNARDHREQRDHHDHCRDAVCRRLWGGARGVVDLHRDCCRVCAVREPLADHEVVD